MGGGRICTQINDRIGFTSNRKNGYNGFEFTKILHLHYVNLKTPSHTFFFSLLHLENHAKQSSRRNRKIRTAIRPSTKIEIFRIAELLTHSSCIFLANTLRFSTPFFLTSLAPSWSSRLLPLFLILEILDWHLADAANKFDVFFPSTTRANK